MTHPYLTFHPKIAKALKAKKPVVALESTVISHGLPYPDNLEVTRQMMTAIEAEDCVPALIVLDEGQIKIGIDDVDLERFARPDQNEIYKVSRHNYSAILADKKMGATTVASTLFCAKLAGIKFFATGGIGGVHRGAEHTFDISADLEEFVHSEVMVVCAGAKSILDIPKTLEVLETKGVPIIGYQTQNFPLFYTASSEYPVSYQFDTVKKVAHFAKTHWALGEKGIVLANPIPMEAALSEMDVEKWLDIALKEASEQSISGKDVTPFLLKRLGELSKGLTKEANKILLIHNAKIAAFVAKAYEAD